MSWETFIVSAAGCVFGALVTWAVSRYYYKKAGDELKNETALVRNETQLILDAFEQADLIELRKENGKIVGIQNWKISLRGFTGTEYGVPEVSKAPGD